MKLGGVTPLTALFQALQEHEKLHIDALRRADLARDNLHHMTKVRTSITKDELARCERQLEFALKFALRDYLDAKSMFEEQFFATMARETKQLFEDEWRMVALERQWTDPTAVSKANLEVFYSQKTSMFND